jgi:hypothetical protein
VPVSRFSTLAGIPERTYRIFVAVPMFLVAAQG